MRIYIWYMCVIMCIILNYYKWVTMQYQWNFIVKLHRTMNQSCLSGPADWLVLSTFHMSWTAATADMQHIPGNSRSHRSDACIICIYIYIYLCVCGSFQDGQDWPLYILHKIYMTHIETCTSHDAEKVRAPRRVLRGTHQVGHGCGGRIPWCDETMIDPT